MSEEEVRNKCIDIRLEAYSFIKTMVDCKDLSIYGFACLADAVKFAVKDADKKINKLLDETD